MASTSQSFSVAAIVENKGNKKVLKKEEIDYVVKSIYDESIYPQQIGAFMMAVYINGMTDEETAHLTMAMVEHSDKFDWPSELAPMIVDKHSSGGIGDKISLILAPLLASCGLKVPMISGRGLGITGGTADKLESIPGYQCVIDDLPRLKEAFMDPGCFIITQGKSFAPVDRQTYHARNITGTIGSRPLITASILSKKMLEGLSTLCMDLKYGPMCFMKTAQEAEQLGNLMIKVANLIGLKMICAIDCVASPTGYCSGNAVEVAEALQCLNGFLLDIDVMDITLTLCSHLIAAQNITSDISEARKLCVEKLQNGEAMEKFRKMLIVQGVEIDLANELCRFDNKKMRSCIDYCSLLDQVAPFNTSFIAHRSGYIVKQDPKKLAKAILNLGAGKRNPNDKLDHSVGLQLLKKVGDYIKQNDPWIVIYHTKDFIPQSEADRINKSLIIQDIPVIVSHPIKKTIS